MKDSRHSAGPGCTHLTTNCVVSRNRRAQLSRHASSLELSRLPGLPTHFCVRAGAAAAAAAAGRIKKGRRLRRRRPAAAGTAVGGGLTDCAREDTPCPVAADRASARRACRGSATSPPSTRRLAGLSSAAAAPLPAGRGGRAAESARAAAPRALATRPLPSCCPDSRPSRAWAHCCGPNPMRSASWRAKAGPMGWPPFAHLLLEHELLQLGAGFLLGRHNCRGAAERCVLQLRLPWPLS